MDNLNSQLTTPSSPTCPNRAHAASPSRDEARSGSASESESRRAANSPDRALDTRASPVFPGGPGVDLGLGLVARQTGTRSGVLVGEDERVLSGYLETTSGTRQTNARSVVSVGNGTEGTERTKTLDRDLEITFGTRKTSTRGKAPVGNWTEGTTGGYQGGTEGLLLVPRASRSNPTGEEREIGRASCRERV